ncbi:MAG TPA: hypothetical protein VFG62_13230 [Rhodopila sp.]|jgi:hypothetical protein|nr:hypothetical protein [Rhodopila sp.]
MPDIVIKVDTSVMERAFEDFKGQIPFAHAVGINNVARAVREQERAAIGEIFAHPRPFTKNSVFLASATKSSPIATIFVRPEAAKYLAPYEMGGLHELPGKALLNPKAVRLDAYGQMRQAQFKELAEKPGNFIGTVHGVAGLWQRPPPIAKGANRRRKLKVGVERIGLKLLVRFGDALEVKKHLGFVERARAIAERELPKALGDAIQKVVDSMYAKGQR